MARKKRSETLAEVVVAKPAPARPEVVTERMIAALCPICGRTIPEKRAIKVGYTTVDHINYFASIDWDENKQFGISFAAAGRGSLKDRYYISPQDAHELFEQVKARFIDAIGEWLKKKWITREELERLIKDEIV